MRTIRRLAGTTIRALVTPTLIISIEIVNGPTCTDGLGGPASKIEEKRKPLKCIGGGHVWAKRSGVGLIQ